MLTILVIIVTSAAVIIGRLALDRWWNHISICCLICGSVIILLQRGQISDTPFLGTTWLYVVSASSFLLLGTLMVWFVRGDAPSGPSRGIAWQQKYLCRLSSKLSATKKLPRWTSWEVFLLFGLQCALLGVSNDLDSGKIVFAAMYIVALVLWSCRFIAYGFAGHEPVIRWTVTLLGLAVFSRLVGMYSGVTGSDWVRDLLPLLHFSWILVGPLAFLSRKSIWRAYLVFVGIDLFLTFVVTDQFLILRKFSTMGLGLTQYVRASDVVVLFGTFMTAPMVALPFSRYRRWFGMLTAVFVSAALFTGTRSHVVAILAGFTFYFWLTGKEGKEFAVAARRAVIRSVALGVVAFVLTLYTGLIDLQRVVQRAESVTSEDYKGLAYRFQEAMVARDGFYKSPMFGQGLGYVMPTVFLDDRALEEDLYIVHDFYMYVPLKFGIVGIVVFFGFLVSLVRTAISTYRQAEEAFDRAFAAGLASLLVALLVESITASRFTDRTSTALLSILVACLLSIRREIALKRDVLAPRALVESRPSFDILSQSASARVSAS